MSDGGRTTTGCNTFRLRRDRERLTCGAVPTTEPTAQEGSFTTSQAPAHPHHYAFRLVVWFCAIDATFDVHVPRCDRHSPINPPAISRSPSPTNKFLLSKMSVRPLLIVAGIGNATGEYDHRSESPHAFSDHS